MCESFGLVAQSYKVVFLAYLVVNGGGVNPRSKRFQEDVAKKGMVVISLLHWGGACM